MLNETVQLRELSDYEVVRKIIYTRGNAIQHAEKNFARSVECMRMYTGMDAEMGLGQWPDSVVGEMVRESRALATFNFVQPIVDNLAGGIMKSPFALEFSPVNMPATSLTDMARDLFFIDRELTDWNAAYLDLVTAGLIHQGDMEMYINFEYDKRYGNVGLRYRLPGTVTYDPTWRSRRSTCSIAISSTSCRFVDDAP